MFSLQQKKTFFRVLDEAQPYEAASVAVDSPATDIYSESFNSGAPINFIA